MQEEGLPESPGPVGQTGRSGEGSRCLQSHQRWHHGIHALVRVCRALCCGLLASDLAPGRRQERGKHSPHHTSTRSTGSKM